MSSSRNVKVRITADLTAFNEALAAAGRSMRRMFRIGPDLSQGWPTCRSPISHEARFETEGTKGYPCPGCGAAL